MAVNTASTLFRRIDVDAYNEDAYKEEDESDQCNGGPDEAEVTSLLHSGRQLDALAAGLKNAPLRNKSQAVKDRCVQLVMRVLCAFKQSDIDAAVDRLSPAQLDLLMKYIYKGFESPQDGSSAALLAWHRKVVDKAGLGCVVRVIADRDRL